MKNRLSPRLYLGAAALLMLAAMAAPSAYAQTPRLITYFNFEDSFGTVPNLQSDPANPPPEQSSTISFGSTLAPPGGVTSISAVAGSNLNFAPGNIQINDKALRLSTTKAKDGAYIQFTVSTLSLINVSLSYATQANGVLNQTLSYSLTGPTGTFVNVATLVANQAPTTGTNFGILTFALPTAVNNQASVTLRLTITPPGSGNPAATADFDNIQLKAVPEPATVASGALGVLGLCWHQRRRLLKARQLLSFGRTSAA